ncbi:50S ribosomal protein L31e [Acidianus brierleyi]|uniref:Large ribosomal subunit protein eL31 n=1 Tax=Acidianus brierleyi TaxID=41673 RepID=A0A2U9IFY9_9CREN|nr:50S ribosomal protein L31e [Acidianus brierleyi]AWR94906.1 50S ribosomal protein L31e [Acidianus brierleyi]
MKEKDNFEMIINLRKVIMSKKTNRSKKAIAMIRKIIVRHFGAEKVLLDPLLAATVSKNREKVSSRIPVVVSKIGEKTYLVKLAVKHE